MRPAGQANTRAVGYALGCRSGTDSFATQSPGAHPGEQLSQPPPRPGDARPLSLQGNHGDLTAFLRPRPQVKGPQG